MAYCGCGRAHSPIMEVEEPITCPFCGESFLLMIDTTVSSQQFVTDCEICCQPIEMAVECQPGEVIAVTVGS